MADSRTGACKVQVESGTCCCAKIKKCLKNDGDMLKGPRSHFEGAPTDQVWDNMNIKIKDDSKE